MPLGDPGSGLLYGASLFIVARAFSNGGSSLTGLEAISNGVSVFREPRGRNARVTLTAMACILAVLVGGVSLLANATHAIPYADGNPTVIAQEARLVFGDSIMGGAAFVAVVLIFAVTKFTEGAWLVVVLFPLGVWTLIRINRRYREEAAALASPPHTGTHPTWSRNTVLVLVDHLDLATVNALRYARTLNADRLECIHFNVDTARAGRLRERWEHSRAADFDLRILPCPDRRIARAASELAGRAAAEHSAEVTVLLPVRVYPPGLSRIMHGNTAAPRPHCR